MIKIICEAGLNWSSFNDAVEYAEKAKEIGADIIKYQYVYNTDLPQLNKGEWKALKGYCDKIGIEFLATPSSEEILDYLIDLEMNMVKIGSDRILQEELYKYIGNNDYLISDGYYNDIEANMYCVSLYPCDSKFIDFDKMSSSEYIGFSDHTLEHNKEWCDKIKACKNIEYVEKHFKLRDAALDANVSLNYDKMAEFIMNLKE